MYSYLFGPVPSRRLGMSLGVDLVPHKVCTFNCVYCECGHTTNLTTEHKEYVPVDDVLDELTRFFRNNRKPDYVTFSGAGEPTLNSRIGDVLSYIKTDRGSPPVALLTNGSLLYDPGVRREVMAADVVLPSLDAATERTFRRLDRPYRALDLTEYIRGLETFRQEYAGKMWLEVMILPGYNDNDADLAALKKAFLRIRPDIIQLNTLDRPGTADNLEPAGREDLERIIDLWELDNVEIIAAAPERKNIKSYRQDTETAILETIARRPCTVEDLAGILGTHVNEVNKYLGVLEKEGEIITVRQNRGVFYKLV